VTRETRGSPKRSPASIGIVEPLSADSAATIAELAAELEQKDAAVLDLQMQVQQLQGRLESTSSNIMVELEEAKSAKKRAEKIGQKVSAELEQLQEELAVLQSERDRLKQARYSLRGTNAAEELQCIGPTASALGVVCGVEFACRDRRMTSNGRRLRRPRPGEPPSRRTSRSYESGSQGSKMSATRSSKRPRCCASSARPSIARRS
jgi:hypothetical protein